VTADEATRIVMSHRLLRRYILPGERVVLATRRHWAKLFEPAATSAVTLLGCGWLSYVLEPTLGRDAYLVWWLWFATLARFAWHLLVWRVEWFVATDKRMLLLTGLITHQIGMMPMMKVTDMRYSRSVLGQMLGFGQFLLESAGQDQALRQINWVANPDATYRDLCALIFTPTEPPPPDGEDDAGPPPAPQPPAPPPDPVPAPPALLPTHGRDGVGEDDGEDEDEDDGYRPGDTQPVHVTPRPDSPWPPRPVEPPRPPRRAASRPIGPPPPPPRRTSEPDERAWDVSEPTARFVDLRHQPRRG